jgi:hypothetical protein
MAVCLGEAKRGSRKEKRLNTEIINEEHDQHWANEERPASEGGPHGGCGLDKKIENKKKETDEKKNGAAIDGAARQAA